MARRADGCGGLMLIAGGWRGPRQFTLRAYPWFQAYLYGIQLEDCHQRRVRVGRPAKCSAGSAEYLLTADGWVVDAAPQDYWARFKPTRAGKPGSYREGGAPEVSSGARSERPIAHLVDSDGGGPGKL